MGVIFSEPLIERWSRLTGLPWACDTLLVEQSQEGAETLGRFGQVAGTGAWKPGDRALYEVFIHLEDGIALFLEPLGKLLSRTKRALCTTWGVSFLAQGGSEMIERRPHRTPPQPGNDALSYKGLVEHVLFLFRKGCLEKEQDRTS